MDRKQSRPAPLAYSYLRFSHPHQATGDSIRRQTELRDAWCKRTGAALDTSLTLEDRGISGFTGEHRKNPDRHALAAFLELVKAGRVPRGSYLIVENLDRLTREDIQPALILFLNLLQAGVRIVQLLPVEQVFDDKSETMQIMLAVLELTRGHSESKMKSERNGRAWVEKRRKAAEQMQPMTMSCPSWLRRDGDRFVLIPDKAATVREIYRLTTDDGLGAEAIVRRFRADGVAPLAGPWNKSYVRLILHNRAVLGEFQPKSGPGASSRTRPSAGPPIPGYYPAVVTQEQWDAARGAMRQRQLVGGGRDARTRVNIFAGLAVDATTGTPLHLTTRITRRRTRRVYSVLAPDKSKVAKGERSASFPLEPLEDAILSELWEINPADVLPRTGNKPDRLVALAGKRADLEAKIAKIKATMTGDDATDESEDFSDLIDVLRQLKAKLADVCAEEAREQQRAASPPAQAWGEFKTLAGAVRDDIGNRRRLRTMLRRIITPIETTDANGTVTHGGVRCVFAPSGRGRFAVVQVWFVGGKYRTYTVCYEPTLVISGKSYPAKCEVASIDGVETSQPDGEETVEPGTNPELRRHVSEGMRSLLVLVKRSTPSLDLRDRETAALIAASLESAAKEPKEPKGDAADA